MIAFFLTIAAGRPPHPHCSQGRKRMCEALILCNSDASQIFKANSESFNDECRSRNNPFNDECVKKFFIFFKKTIDKSVPMCYNKYRKREKEVIKMMKIYRVAAQDLNDTKVFDFNTYENAYNWVMADNWYFEKAIFEKEFEVAENGMIVEKNTKKVFEKN